MRRIGREEVRMKKYVGIGVYDAVAEGNIAVYGKEEYVPEKVYRGDLPGEKARLEAGYYLFATATSAVPPWPSSF